MSESHQRELWSQADLIRLKFYHVNLEMEFDECGEALGRTTAACKIAFRTRVMGRPIRRNARSPVPSERAAPDESLVDRELRQAAMAKRSLTAQLCGDPPPGYSALDGK